MACGDGVYALGRRDDQQLQRAQPAAFAVGGGDQGQCLVDALGALHVQGQGVQEDAGQRVAHIRSEEHTSELQSQSNLVCRLLLEKKKKKNKTKSKEIQDTTHSKQ